MNKMKFSRVFSKGREKKNFNLIFFRIKIHSTERKGYKARPASKQSNKIKTRQHC